MRKITEIIVHCTATPAGLPVTVEQIDAYHRSLGWAGIGYHYLIDLKGQIHKGRDIRRPGAHCRGHNAHSIGVAYVGGLSPDGLAACDTRTDAQRLAMAALLKRLHKEFPDHLRSPRFRRQGMPLLRRTRGIPLYRQLRNSRRMMRFAAALVLLLGAAGCAAPRQTAVEKTDSAATEVRTVRDSVSRSVELRFDTVEMTVVRRDSTIVWLRGSGASIGARRTEVSADSATVSVARNSEAVAHSESPRPLISTGAAALIIAALAVLLVVRRK